MDHLEMVEQVMLKTGCSFKDAKEALEHSEWSILDAVLYLEDNGQADQASSRFSTGEQDASDTAFASEMQQERSEAESEGPSGSAPHDAGSENSCSKAGAAIRRFFQRAKSVLTQNYLILFGKSGTQLFRLPIWIALIPFLVWFWGILLICIGAMIFGCRFQFEGADFGRSNINDAVSRAGDAAYSAGQKIKEEFSGKNGES